MAHLSNGQFCGGISSCSTILLAVSCLHFVSCFKLLTFVGLLRLISWAVFTTYKRLFSLLH